MTPLGNEKLIDVLVIERKNNKLIKWFLNLYADLVPLLQDKITPNVTK